VSELPRGTVTLLFSDIEGSTRLLRQLGERYGEALRTHRLLLRDAFRSNTGVEVDTQGDAFLYAFSKATDAVAAARAGQAALAATGVRVRMGLHTGEPRLTEEGYVGIDVHRAARICSAAHGGQVLLSAATARLVEIDLRDLGEHRLKDIETPERLYQLGHEDFSPLRAPPVGNLPVASTALIGREREFAEVVSLLRGHRIVTLVGPGGSGKTRLALHVAGALRNEFRDGVYWVPLAAVREPGLVEPLIAHAVGVTGGLADHLAERDVLLLLDNLEQVVEAAPLLADLLGSTARLQLLVTSREPLRLSGEQEYPVLPLLQTDAVALFLQRARAMRPDFVTDDAVTEICRRLDGLPLALELAAARVKVLTPEQILERLSHRLELLTTGARDLPERQRTVRATLDWSYELLTMEERELLVALAAFSGGWTLEAAEAVCSARLDSLESLVDKSLVSRDGERFGMLETVREYALERLDGTGERENVLTRHARFFLALAEEGVAELDRGDEGIWTQRLRNDHDNLAAALESFGAEPSLELHLVALIWRVWFEEGRWQEARQAIERALASPSETSPDRVAVMLGAAWILWRQGDVPAGTRFAEESLALSRVLDDPLLVARSLRILGTCINGDQPDRAAQLTEESAALAESIGDRGGLTAALNNLALSAVVSGNNRRAVALLTRAHSIARQAGDRRGCCVYLMNLADTERRLGEFEQARTHLAESFGIARKLAFREVVVEVVYALAALAAAAGDHEWAGALLGVAQQQNDFGHILEDLDREAYEQTRSSVREALGPDEADGAITAGRALTLDAVTDYLEERA
jgi:predicted ATPase